MAEQYRPLRTKVVPSTITPLPDSAGWAGVQTMISSVMLLGIPGYLLDRWLGTSWIVAIGLILGMALALTILWFRYGTGRREVPGADEAIAVPRPDVDQRSDSTEGRG